MFQNTEELLNNISVYPVYFTKEWVEAFSLLLDSKSRMWKLDRLGNKVANLHPNIISYRVDEDVLNGKAPWLYVAHAKEPLVKLSAVTRNFILNLLIKQNVEFKGKLSERFLTSVASYREEVPLEEKVKNKALLKGVARYLYHQQKKTFSILEKGDEIRELEVDFHHAFSSGKHEVISSPILVKKNAYFSYVVYFDVYEEPFSSNHYLQANISKRRWMNKKIFLKKRHSLYLRDKINREILRFSVEYKKGKGPSFSSEEEKKIFEQATNNTVLLDDVLDNPTAYLEHPDYFIGIPYSESLFGGSFPIGSGVSPQEKRAIFENVKETFNYLEAMPLIENDAKNGDNPIQTLIKKVELTQEEVQAILQENETLGKSAKKIPKTKACIDFNLLNYLSDEEEIDLLVCEDKNEVSDRIKEVLNQYCLHIDEIDNNEYFFETNNRKFVTLKIHSIKKNNTDLPLLDDELDSYLHREDDIERLLSDIKLTGKPIVLYELTDYRNTSENDPKQAIRNAFLKQHIKTQFIQPMTEDTQTDIIRVKSALLDLFSKNGMTKSMKKLTYTLFGFQVLKLNVERIVNKKKMSKIVYLPVLTKLQNNDFLFYFFDNKDWVGFDKINVKIQTKLEELRKVPLDKLINPAFLDTKADLVAKLKEVESEKIIVIPAALRNYHFPLVKNEELHEENELLTSVENLAVVRANTGNELPSYLTFKTEVETMKEKGIFSLNDHTFFSIADKPDTDSVGKWDNTLKTSSKQFQQRKLVELVVLSNLGDGKEADIAKLVHHTRGMMLTSSAYLAHDVMVYHIEQLKEYLSLHNLYAE